MDDIKDLSYASLNGVHVEFPFSLASVLTSAAETQDS